MVLTLNALPGEHGQTLDTWIALVAAAVGPGLLISDGADGFKTAADALGLELQVCKSNVKRNRETLVEDLQTAVAQDGGSLAAIGATREQAVADLEHLERLIHSRQPEEQKDGEALRYRHANASSPRKG